MNLKLPHFDPVSVLYYSVAAATLLHTTWAMANILQGPMPGGALEQVAWYLEGGLMALAIDMGLIVAAKSLSRAFSWWMLVAFVVSALASFCSQVFYAVSHTDALHLTAGVSTYWTTTLLPFLDARVVIFPAALPALGIFYTLAKSSRGRHLSGSAVQAPSESLRVTREPLELPEELADVIYRLRQGEVIVGELQEVGYYINTSTLTFRDLVTERIYGPYQSLGTMVGALRMAGKRPQLPPSTD